MFPDQPSASSSSEILLPATVLPEPDTVSVTQSKQELVVRLMPVTPLNNERKSDTEANKEVNTFCSQ